MHVLMARPAACADPGGPVKDKGIRDATFMGIAVEALERRISGPSPSPWVVVVGFGSAQVVDPFEVLLKAFWDEVEEILLVERSPRPTLGGGTIVAHDDDDRVLRLTKFLYEIKKARYLRIGMGEEAGKDLHEPSGKSPFVSAQCVPGRDP